MDNLKHLAEQVDSSLDAFEAAASAYVKATAAANKAHIEKQFGVRSGNHQPHAVYADGHDHVKHAVRGRHDLARMLGMGLTERRLIAARHS